MTFVPPMLYEILRDLAQLDDPQYAAEPRFDGQRADVPKRGRFMG
jgi:hypothetical protein